MKAKIISIIFALSSTKRKTICIITFNDPYWNNVKRVVKGVAKCNPYDTFDETLGRRIAEGRAKRAMFQKLYISARNLRFKIENEQYIQGQRAIKETQHIQELLNKHYNEQQN